MDKGGGQGREVRNWVATMGSKQEPGNLRGPLSNELRPDLMPLLDCPPDPPPPHNVGTIWCGTSRACVWAQEGEKGFAWVGSFEPPEAGRGGWQPATRLTIGQRPKTCTAHK